VRTLYDAAQIAAPQQYQRAQSPISSRPSGLGQPTANFAQDPEKGIEQTMDRMGCKNKRAKFADQDFMY